MESSACQDGAALSLVLRLLVYGAQPNSRPKGAGSANPWERCSYKQAHHNASALAHGASHAVQRSPVKKVSPPPQEQRGGSAACHKVLIWSPLF